MKAAGSNPAYLRGSPDRHLVIAKNHIHLTRGPKKGLHRPSINVTFRSAAQNYGPKVVGILLSGMLDDGASGLWEISRHGGVGIIQDPDEAQCPSMPLNALRDAPIHFRLPSSGIAPVLLRLVEGGAVPATMTNEGARPEQFSGLTCPECHGPLFREDLTSSLVEFRCRVGHVFSPHSLLEEHTSTQERKLYEAILSLEDGEILTEFMADRVEGTHREQLLQEAAQLKQHAAGIRKMIAERVMPALDPAVGKKERSGIVPAS